SSKTTSRRRVPTLPVPSGGQTARADVIPGRRGPAHGVVPVSTATNTPGKPIRAGIEGGVIAFTPDGKTAYAGGSGTVTPINTATNTPANPIRAGIEPVAIAATPDGKTAYAPRPLSTTPPTPPSPPPPAAGSPCSLASPPARKAAYVTGAPPSDALPPITTATNTPGKPIRVVFPDAAPDEIAITPDGKTAYVASYGGGPGSVIPISTTTNTPGKPIRIGSDATIPITPDGKTLYAATSNKVVPV